RCAPGEGARDDVAHAVTDQGRSPNVELELLCGADEEARPRLAAVAVRSVRLERRVRVVKADVYTVQLRPSLLPDPQPHRIATSHELGFGGEPARDDGLIRDHHQGVTGL